MSQSEEVQFSLKQSVELISEENGSQKESDENKKLVLNHEDTKIKISQAPPSKRVSMMRFDDNRVTPHSSSTVGSAQITKNPRLTSKLNKVAAPIVDGNLILTIPEEYLDNGQTGISVIESHDPYT